jgi:hypothetical protein
MKKISQKIKGFFEKRNLGYKAKAVGLNLAFMLLFSFGAFAQGNVGGSIQQLFKDQIKPVLDAVLIIGVAVATLYCGFMFFQGKREAFKQLAFIMGGALVIKFLSVIVEGIMK